MSAVNACRFCGHLSRFHRREPSDYHGWMDFAERLSRTHHQEPCPDCGRLTIWKPGSVEDASA